jgi:beta-N-acetylhexosaminidase
MRSSPKIFSLILLLLSVLLGLTAGSVSGQDVDYDAIAQLIFDEMSVSQRVGQIFLVTFEGSDASLDSDIADLILNYSIGGVVLSADNENIISVENSALDVAALAGALQQIALTSTSPFTSTEVSADGTPIPVTPLPPLEPPTNPVPLFIAMTHEGDGPPFTQIYEGLTALPNQAAVGATWETDNSFAVGEITGRELNTLGINMLIGPSLDVLENPSPDNPSDLGMRTYGGDPYWVGLMGKAFIEGVHLGGDNRVSVIAKHFPGFGSSDRPLHEEVGTVRKSLEQLKQIELAPFTAVTGDAQTSEEQADGLLSSHIRYQGFQGNIRATTAPVSFDPQALTSLMSLSEFEGWRQNGGIIVSDELGVRAVERFYDATGQEFPHRQVARDALLAGNDLLYLSNFALGDAAYREELANIKDTIEWFRERYETDQSFQQRVDEAVLRLLKQKLEQYGGEFDPQNVFVNDLSLAVLGQDEATTFAIAGDALTLISPSQAELDEQLPPEIDDNVVIFTDVRVSRQCSTCSLEPWIDQNAIEQRMLALYGPDATQQVNPRSIRSFSFDDLKEFLTFRPPPATPEAPPDAESTSENEEGTITPVPTPTLGPVDFIQSALEQADWVVFATLEPDPEIDSSDALNLFLAQRPDIARDARVIVFAFNAPYTLDTTEISQLAAYFGLYAKGDAFIDASVRALYGESPLSGRSPFNIPAIGYDLFEVTRPDSGQVIELFIVDENTPKSPPSEAPLEVVPGATLRLQTGRIVDNNGSPVPDGTLVKFIQQDRIQGFVNVIAERPTTGGVANLDYLLDARSGNFRITAEAGDAIASQEIDIVIGENAVVSINTPTPTPTLLPTATNTPTSTATPTIAPTSSPTLTPSLTATPEPEPTTAEEALRLVLEESQMLIALGFGLAVTGSFGYFIGRNGERGLSNTVRWILWGLVGALVAYNYYILPLPGMAWLDSFGIWAALAITIAGGLLGFGLFFLVGLFKN